VTSKSDRKQQRTVTNVAGKNVKVTKAMVFIAAPSTLVARAISELIMDVCRLTLLSRWDIILESLRQHPN